MIDESVQHGSTAYTRLLWGTMNALGVTDSITRKMMTAVTLQFVSTLGLFVLPVVVFRTEVFSIFPPVLMAATALVFALAIVAFVNTLLIVRQSLSDPVSKLQETAIGLGNGDTEVALPDVDQRDELGDLADAFEDIHEYVNLSTEQATAVRNQDFDAPVLDREVPGELGEALQDLRRDIRDLIADLEAEQQRIAEQNEHLTEAAESYEEVISRVAEGDLKERLSTDVDHEAMEAIARAFNDMVAEWEHTVGEIQNVAENVRVETDTLRASANEVEQASGEIADSIEEISDGTDEEATRLTEVASEMQTLSATVEEITASAEDVATLAEKTAGEAEKGRVSAEEATGEMEAISRQTAEAVDAFEDLTDRLEEVGEITDIIADIAEQTNLLALNASIEAARIGEEADGFEVVADEIKGLSEETKRNAEEIESVVRSVQSLGQEASREIEDVQSSVSTGRETVEDAADAFGEMAEMVADIDTTIREVSDATAEQADTSQGILTNVDEISALSDQNAGEANSVASAAEEQTMTMGEVTDAIAELDQQATSLDDRLDAFTIETAVDRSSQPAPARSVTDGGFVFPKE